MHVNADNRHVVLFVNDFNVEFAVALKKLSDLLGRPLKGVTLIDADVKTRGLNKPDRNQEFQEIVCDFADPMAIARAVAPFLEDILIICASSDRNQPFFKALIPHVPYVLAPTETSIDWATNKTNMRRLLEAYGSQLTVKSRLVTAYSTETVDDLCAELTFPLIVKPNGLAASILVTKAHTREELTVQLEHAFSTLGDVYKRDRGRGTPSIVVEEFIEGAMYSVDAYVSDDGQVWCLPPVKVTTAHSIGKEGFYSYQLDSAHGLDEAAVSSAFAACTELFHALKLRSSTAHIELFHTADGGWKVIELGPRAGGYRQDMYSLSYDIDHAYNELLVKMGREPVISSIHKRFSGGINIYAEEEGVIESIEGFEEASKLPNIHRLTLFAKPGDLALFCGNGGKFIVDGVVYGNSAEQLQSTINRIRDLIKITVKQ